MQSPVHIVSQGIICSIGCNWDEVYLQLIKEETGIAWHSFSDKKNLEKFPLGKVSLSNQELADITGFEATDSRTILLGAFAALQAKNNLKIDYQRIEKVGFISANTVGGMDKTESVFDKVAADETVDYTAFLRHDAGCSTELIAKKIGATYFYTTISTACSSAANAIILGAKMIQQNKLDLVFVGGVDALTSFTVEGFNSLQILDKNLCKPFDKDRNGLNLGEGAAYLVLASDKIIKEFGLTSLGTVAGFANCNDSYHQTASSPDGKGNLLVMQNAIAMSNISTQAIDYINLHGTGTANNDMAEGIAMKTLFGENVPAFSSTKSYTGHTLAACGAIEGVIALLAIKHQKAFANLRFETPIEEHQLTPINKTISKKINHVLSNSFGFGGNCSAIVFSKS